MEGRKHIKDTLKKRTCLGFTEQIYNLTKSRFLGYITVVCCLFPPPPRSKKNVVLLHFTDASEALASLYLATCGCREQRDRNDQLKV